MRWFKSAETTPLYCDGDKRRVRRFLVLPTELYVPTMDKYQVRWLEMATIEQKFELRGNFEITWFEWVDVAFIDGVIKS